VTPDPSAVPQVVYLTAADPVVGAIIVALGLVCFGLGILSMTAFRRG